MQAAYACLTFSVFHLSFVVVRRSRFREQYWCSSPESFQLFFAQWKNCVLYHAETLCHVGNTHDCLCIKQSGISFPYNAFCL